MIISGTMHDEMITSDHISTEKHIGGVSLSGRTTKNPYIYIYNSMHNFMQIVKCFYEIRRSGNGL